MQGRIVARDLLENGFSTFLADIQKGGSEGNLTRFPKTAFATVDLRTIENIIEVIKKAGAPIVINCAEGDWNLNVYKACLATKKHVLDLGSDIPMTKEQMALGPFFKEDDLIGITGCGSTPGVNNIMLNYAIKELDTIHDIEAGFVWDSNIKKFVVPFSIESILDELTHPAPALENGEWVTKEPLKNVKVRDFRGIGKQKYFPVEHPETFTFYINYEKEGLKNMTFYAGFPDHSLDKLMSFIELGIGDKETVIVDGKEIRPIDALTQSLRRLKTPEDYKEYENLWVEVRGEKDSKPKAILMECIVPTLTGWEDAGCNIDTGMTASIIAQMIKDGRINTRGSYTPAMVIPEEEFFKELRTREMIVHKDGIIINQVYNAKIREFPDFLIYFKNGHNYASITCVVV